MTLEIAGGMQAFASSSSLIMGLLKPLEDLVPNLKVRSLIEPNFSPPYVFARAIVGAWSTNSFGTDDRRFLQGRLLDVQAFTEGPDGDTSADALLELCWQQLWSAKVNGTKVPGVGYITYLRTVTPPRRVPDWASSTGVQQYANLPKGYTRYQTTLGIVHRPDFDNPVTVADLVALASL